MHLREAAICQQRILLARSDDAHLRQHVLYAFLPVFRKKHICDGQPQKARLTTLIQNLVIFTKLGARVDNEVLQGTKR